MDMLNSQFGQFMDKKAMSDTIIYRPVKYKVLFGPEAESELQAKFRVVKLPNTSLTDNEIKSKLVDAITEFFHIDNWDFGEEFFFTELAAHVHQSLAGVVSSFVIVPMSSDSVFGDLFQIKAESNEFFVSTAKVSDIEIIDKITKTTLAN